MPRSRPRLPARPPKSGRSSSTSTVYRPARCWTCRLSSNIRKSSSASCCRRSRTRPVSAVHFRSCARASGLRAAIRDQACRRRSWARTPTRCLPSSAIRRARSMRSHGRTSYEAQYEIHAAADADRRLGTSIMSTDTHKSPEEWWSTSIIDMKPGSIRIRGYAIEALIGRIGFAEMVYLMTRGELPQPGAAQLLEAALVAAVDHGPQAPSIAAARMAMTCGIGINNAMASAINMLGDVHGGAGEQCVALLYAVAARLQA